MIFSVLLSFIFNHNGHNNISLVVLSDILCIHCLSLLHLSGGSGRFHMVIKFNFKFKQAIVVTLRYSKCHFYIAALTTLTFCEIF